MVITSWEGIFVKQPQTILRDLPGENDEEGEDGEGDPAGVGHAGHTRHLGVLGVVELVDDPGGQVVLTLGDHRYVQHRVIGPGLF